MDGEGGTLGQIGYAITGSGGGGAGGQYVFADLDEVSAIITEAETIRDEIHQDGRALWQAASLIVPPAEDDMSVMEAEATIRCIEKAARHNEAMAAYVDAELTKLRACRAAYLTTEEDSVARLRNASKADPG